MANYTKTNVGSAPRTELHDTLGLTGAEVSINQLPAGAGVPFVHAHQQNEEIYGILAGKGKAVIDGEEIALTAGDWLKVAPAAKRQFSAAADSSIRLTLNAAGKNAELAVENAGEPIPADKLPHLFDRFYRVDDARTGAAGFGLGLAIARQIVQHHRGAIVVRSDTQATRFIVTLPLHR